MKVLTYISEIKLKQNLRKVGAISIVSLIILVIFAVATFNIVSYVYRESNNSQIEATVQEYVINIKRQAQGELKTLRTLAMFTVNPDDLFSNYSSNGGMGVKFDVIGYWYLDGTCRQLSLSGLKYAANYTLLPPQVKLAISSAWLGHTTVSAPYYSPTMGQDMISYVTPVYDTDGNIVAALSGAVTQVSLDKNLEALSNINKGVDAFITTSSGSIFGHGTFNALPHDLENITDLEGLSETSLDMLRLGLVSNRNTSVNVDIKGNNYRLSLTPLGFSDWYLGVLHPDDLSSSPFFKSLALLVLILVIVFAVCAFIAIYLFISMKSSFKTQLLIAHYDPVTNSWNYPKFLLEFDQLDYRRFDTPTYAVATLNIHDFSYITDMLGEIQADELLCEIARVIQEQPHVVMYCHHERDQFYLILDLEQQEAIDAKMRYIMDICVKQVNANISSIPLVMYSGVSLAYPDLAPDKLVARAEFAKKQIAKSYTHAVRFYDENSYKKEAFLHSIEKSMRRALENQEFKLFLQPKIDLKTGKIYAAEALVRWISDSDAVIYPNDFIPLFEQNGFCTQLDLYMFDKVCQKIRYYLDNNIDPIYFSINQTKLLIFQKGYTRRLKEMLKKYNIPPKYIVIEVLEDLATHNVNELNMHIQELKSIGLSIALDDFGSGYSSLNIVAGLDIDEIKFDREFLLAEDPEQVKKNQMILRVLSSLAKNLGIRTVVEGVERNEDVEFLKGIDCDLAQGYYYDRPIPADVFDKKYMLPSDFVEKSTLGMGPAAKALYGSANNPNLAPINAPKPIEAKDGDKTDGAYDNAENTDDSNIAKDNKSNMFDLHRPSPTITGVSGAAAQAQEQAGEAEEAVIKHANLGKKHQHLRPAGSYPKFLQQKLMPMHRKHSFEVNASDENLSPHDIASGFIEQERIMETTKADKAAAAHAAANAKAAAAAHAAATGSAVIGTQNVASTTRGISIVPSANISADKAPTAAEAIDDKAVIKTLEDDPKAPAVTESKAATEGFLKTETALAKADAKEETPVKDTAEEDAKQ